MDPKKKIPWYEPYSKVRKVLWYWTLAVAVFCAPGTFIGETEKIRLTYAAYTAINLFICWLAFDNTFEIKKEEENE